MIFWIILSITFMASACVALDSLALHVEKSAVVNCQYTQKGMDATMVCIHPPAGVGPAQDLAAAT